MTRGVNALIINPMGIAAPRTLNTLCHVEILKEKNCRLNIFIIKQFAHGCFPLLRLWGGFL